MSSIKRSRIFSSNDTEGLSRGAHSTDKRLEKKIHIQMKSYMQRMKKKRKAMVRNKVARDALSRRTQNSSALFKTTCLPPADASF